MELRGSRLAGRLQRNVNVHVKRLSCVAALLAACSSAPNPTGQDAVACVEERRDIPIAIERDLDILLVVDASPSMADEAGVWAANITRFANVLEYIEGGMPNLHIGVVSSDVAARGGVLESAPRVPDCTAPDGAFISNIAYANGEHDINYEGELADALACIALLPQTGSEIEQPLEAMKRALDDSNPENEGFVRDDAYLLVLFITDEDDCSGGDAFDLDEPEERSAWRCFADGVQCDQAVDTSGTKSNCTASSAPATLTPVDDYAQFLHGLKSDPSRVIVSAIADASNPVVADSNAGLVLAPSCSTATTEARPAHRLAGFLDEFPGRNAMSTICSDDWTDALLPVAEQLAVLLIAKPCFDGAIDLEPDEPGIQHECQVSQLRFADSDQQEETLLFECSFADAPDDERPCWWIDEDADCALDGGYGFEVLRGRESVPGGTTVRVRCHAGC